MTRDKYLSLRKTNNLEFDIIYAYYIENCTKNCLKPEEFLKGINMYPGFQNCYNVSLEYFDRKFTLVTIFDKNQKIITHV